MEFSFDLTADRQHVHDAVKGESFETYSDIATPTLTSTSTTSTPFGSPGAKNFTLSSTATSSTNMISNPYANIKFNEPEPLTTFDEFDNDKQQSSSVHSLGAISNKLSTKSPSSMPTTSSTLQTTSTRTATNKITIMSNLVNLQSSFMKGKN
ncbi:unnamed protein product [Wickerhamomyces anomalus]